MQYIKVGNQIYHGRLGVQALKFKSTLVDWKFILWKLDLLSYKCFEFLKCFFLNQIWEKNGCEEIKSSQRLKVNWRKEISILEIGIFEDDWCKFWRKRKNNVFQSTSTMVDAIFNCFKHFVGVQNSSEKIWFIAFE